MSCYYYHYPNFYETDQCTISPFDRGLNLADGIFETIRVVNYTPELWSHHMQRLIDGCHRLCIDFNDIALLTEIVQTLIDKNHLETGVVKIIISRGISIRGLRIYKDMIPTIICTTSVLPIPPTEIRAIISDIRRNETSPLSRIKSLNYGDNIIAQYYATEKGYDDALLLNTKGEICCFTVGNIVIETHFNEILTPPPETGCIIGTNLSMINNLKFRNFDFNEIKKIWRSNCITGLIPVKLDY
jgi:branched-chain amino acid aminotransferase